MSEAKALKKLRNDPRYDFLSILPEPWQIDGTIPTSMEVGALKGTLKGAVLPYAKKEEN